MKVRLKDKPGVVFDSSKFNIHGLGEVIGIWEDGDRDSVFIKGLDVLINGEWKDMSGAFRNHDLIVDSYNTYFFQPKNEEDRKRGFTSL